jgi:hypothetical protein
MDFDNEKITTANTCYWLAGDVHFGSFAEYCLNPDSADSSDKKERSEI